jgi:type II secretory pathway component GspD/PulD (secretin)
MEPRWIQSNFAKRFWPVLCLCAVLIAEPATLLGAPKARFTFENADIKIVIAEVARLTGMTFLFDPARVQGTITVLAPGDVTPAQAFDLLRSALALHGYALLDRPEGMWVMPAQDVAPADFVVRVIPLTYADAGEVALTLAWVAPAGVRVVPHFPTNSVVIAGHDHAVEQLIDAIRRR